MAHKLDALTDEQKDVIVALILDPHTKLMQGAEEWDLTEQQEMVLWSVIDELKSDDE